MKNIIIFLLLLSGAFTACADVDSTTITISVPRSIAIYVAANVPGSAAIQSAIATASDGITDSLAIVDVTVTEGQVVTIMQALTVIPEGVGATPNKTLLDTLLPLLPARPWLMQQIGTIQAGNTARFNDYLNRGNALIRDIQQANNNNK